MPWSATAFALGLTGLLMGSGCALATPLSTPTPPSLGRPTAAPTAERPPLTPVLPAVTPTTATEAENPTGPDGQPTLVVVRPQAGQRVRSPLAVEGTAITFEGIVNVALRDNQGRALQEGVAFATRGAPERGDFALSLTFASPAAEAPGTLEVFIRSPRDGSVMHRLRVPVLVAP